MDILVVGGGGREHALAHKIASSPRSRTVFVAPGNGGTVGDRIQQVEIPATDLDRLLAFALERAIGLTVVGPEVPLAQGIVDQFTEAGLRCVGPTAAAARLEASKAFSKAFMDRHQIPTARWKAFTTLQDAVDHLNAVPYPVVIKANGLAAGKGVILPDSADEARTALAEIMGERRFGSAGETVVIEERLVGEEASVLAFCDGTTVRLMPAAQDHKRALNGDLGANTGGMGAYAPAPVLDDGLREQARALLQATVDGMAAEGSPYKGVLYIGLMITADGPRVLEFNCRFGDPETQVIIPLLASDLVDAFEACVEGTLLQTEIAWRSGAAATVVCASGGYPGAYQKGLAIHGVADANQLPGVTVYHAGTRRTEAALLTHGGRVLAVTGVASNLRGALDLAYEGLAQVRFANMHYRHDIGHCALARL